MVEMLQESLRCLGFSSIGTSDPQFALELVDQGRVRVVMSDIKMPGMDGLQFLEQAMRATRASMSADDRILLDGQRHRRRQARRLRLRSEARGPFAAQRSPWTNLPSRSTSGNASAAWSSSF
jgi:CheY-like chemotaxis protein